MKKILMGVILGFWLSGQGLAAEQIYPNQLLLNALQTENQPEIEKALDAGANPNLLYGREPLLQLAAGWGNLQLIQRLLEMKEDPNDIFFQPPKDENTLVFSSALLKAGLNGHKEALRLLINHGADPELPLDLEAQTVLMQMAAHGDLAVIQTLVELGAQLETQDIYRRTALFYAAEKGHLPVLQWLSNKGLNIHTSDRFGHTLLHQATTKNQIAVVKFLLSQGMNPNRHSDLGWIPLQVALHWGHLELAKMLLEAGSNPNHHEFEEGKTPLFQAVEHQHKHLVEILLKAKADPNLSTTNGNTPLLQAASTGNLAMVELLLRYGANPNLKHKRTGQSALQWAEKLNKPKMVQTLLKKGASPQDLLRPIDKNLLNAVQTGNLKQVKQLLNNGGRLHIRNADGNTPLHLAIQARQPEMAILLLQRGVKVEILNDKNQSVLDLAVEDRQPQLVKLLLEKASGVYTQRPELKVVALNHAILLDDLESVNLLLAHHTPLDANAPNEYLLPLYNAALNEKKDIVLRLIESGANPNSYTSALEGPLLVTVSRLGKAEMVQILLSKGAQIQSRNHAGETALLTASQFAQPAMIQVLLESGANPRDTNADGQTAVMLFMTSYPNAIHDWMTETTEEERLMEEDELERLFDSFENEYQAILERLLAHPDTDLEAQDKSGNTALFYAIASQSTTFLETLIEKGANVQHQNSVGVTALMYAAQQGRVDMIELLLEEELDLKHKDKRGLNAYDYTLLSGDADTIGYLQALMGLTEGNEDASLDQN